MVVDDAAPPATATALARALPASLPRRPVTRPRQLSIEAAAPVAVLELPPHRISRRPRALDVVVVPPAVPATAPALPSRHLSRRLLALAAVAPALSAAVTRRTGQLGSLVNVACVLSSVAEVGTSRVLPDALAADAREVQRGPRVPWVVPTATADAVPPLGLRSLARHAPPLASTLGGRILGGENRARLLSLLSLDQVPLLEASLVMPGMQQ
jgi:hypothetical protein